MCNARNIHFFSVVVSKMQTDSCFLERFKVDDQLFVTPYAPRVKFVTNKDAWDEARTKFRLFILLVFSSWAYNKLRNQKSSIGH